ncbi:V-type ATP synthase subunit I, partial [Thermococcus sp.]|uniref:V-type ATP synthase subunit I n=1 Tax=Thermococcus sp. TaxID=35749 RepID=UPI0026119BDC
KVLEGIKKVTKGKAYINVREPSKEEIEEIPIKLKNPGWARPFEMLTEMYGVPRYDEIDPTPIIAFTYSFFFGFMLTDFFYGLIVGIVAALLVKGHKKFNDGTYKFAYTLLISSFFTMFMGILFGSYFGNAGDIVLQYITGNPNAHFWRIADSLKDPMFVLTLALAIGLAHLFTGYTIGFIVKWKNGDAKGAVLEQLPWMLIILAIALFATKKASLMLPAKALFGIGIVLFAIGEIVANGGLAALMIISDFFGFVGTWLSYARLMALALATSGIAMVVNVLAGMVWGIKISVVPLGIIIGIIVFIGGQLFSTAINALGAFVHSLRLQYVEFFGTFYSGEGRPFTPFKSKREVSKLELKLES